VKCGPWLLLAALVGLAPAAEAWEIPNLGGRRQLKELNGRLHGQIVDYTHNHGADRRIWSDALQRKRDLYVYLPPGFDPARQYPLIVWFHGILQDERAYLKYLAEPMDQAMACGKLPPSIVMVPDGSLDGSVCYTNAGSFFLNMKAGRYEDWAMTDAWNFVMTHYPVRPEREAHLLTGVSMGGGAAFHLGIKYKDRVKAIAGIFPPVNTRYLDCRGRYRAPFDPDCQGLRTDFSRGHETIGRYFIVFKVTLRRLFDPLYDRKDPDVAMQVARENPYEMLDLYDVKPGELAMFIAYAGKDEFNLNAQVESFLYKARYMGLKVDTAYDPRGHHDVKTAMRFFPVTRDWIAEQLAPYAATAVEVPTPRP
jgi:S-formylglutathione hydrolase FrmB